MFADSFTAPAGLARAVLLAVLVATSAQAGDDDPYHSWTVEVGASYDSNLGMASASTTLPDGNSGELRGLIGLSLGQYLSQDGGDFVALNYGADVDLRASTLTNNLSQAIPDVWINLHLLKSRWTVQLTLSGAYHVWGSDQANAIEPSGTLSIGPPSFVTTRAANLRATAEYDFAARISRANDPAMQSVYNGMTHTGRAGLVFDCLGPGGCPSGVPDEIRLGYAFSAGDFVSVGPPAADAAAVAKASAPSNLFDNDHPLGYHAYRLGAVSHTFQAKIWFTTHPVSRCAVFAQYEHSILVDGAFQATADRISAGLNF